MVWILLCLLAVLPALLAQGSRAQDDNLLVNGGFEDGTTGWLAVAGELSVDESFVRGGSYAGVFVADDTLPRHELSYCLAIAPSTDYRFTGFAARREGDLASNLQVNISWYGQDDCFGEEIGGGLDMGGVELSDPGHWYQLEVEAKSLPSAYGVRLRVVVKESGATVYLDDFAVRTLVAPTETPTVEPSPTLTATPGPAIPSPSATPHVSPTASSWQRTPVPAQNTLRNGGFEEADRDGLPSFWRQYGGELIRTDEEHFEGKFAAALSTKTNSVKWAYQLVTVQGGRAYVLSAHALKTDPAIAVAFLRLSWYANREGSGEAIDSADSTTVLADDSPEFRFLTTGPVVAPAKAASAKVRLMLAPVGQAPGTVYFDAVTFEQTVLPEPAVSATATPSVLVAKQTPTPTSPAFAEPTSSAPDEVDTIPASEGIAAALPPSPTGSSGAGSATPVVLGAVRPPATTVAAAATATTRAPYAVFRQRKADPLVGDEASAPAESDEGGLPSPLLALAAGVPALAGMSAGMYYWRWRRARLR